MRHSPTAALKAWLAISALAVASAVPAVTGMAVALVPIVDHKPPKVDFDAKAGTFYVPCLTDLRQSLPQLTIIH